MVREITQGDADDFRINLLRPKPPKINGKRTGDGGEGLSEATTRRRCAIAKQFMRVAVRKGIITANPFADIVGTVKSNKARMRFISREDSAKVLEACPDDEWRLIFALSRFGGLRTPSEHNGLRWGDVDLPGGRFLVHSPKTEHHEGGDSRWVPIFPELRPYLEAAYDRAPHVDPTATPAEKEAASFVLQRYRNQANLRTRFFKIIKRAGLKPWPKVFQNLRSTRQTELSEIFPTHVVCAWLGNKAAVAAEHYLQVTTDHFERAATAGPASGALVVQSVAIHDVLQSSGSIEKTPKEPRRTLVNAIDSASENPTSRPGGTRTHDQGIMSPLL